MTDDIPIELSTTAGICQDCKHLAPRLRHYGKVHICHACTARRRKAARQEQPQTQRRDRDLEPPRIHITRCTDCQHHEPNARHWGDSSLCLTCENQMLERIGHDPYTIEHDRITV